MALFVLLIGVTVSCEEKPTKDMYGFTEEDPNVAFAGLLTFQTYTPNLTNKTISDPTSGLMWKICTQGQQFVQTGASTYTCTGQFSGPTGTSYGASQIQYCDKALPSCNTLSLPQVLTNLQTFPITGSSEAFVSCNTDTTGGFSDWRVAAFPELKALSASSRNAMFLKFPNTVEDFYWSSWANEQDAAGETARAVSFSRDRFGEDQSFKKTSRHYVRCVRNLP
ncbi:hypothetical protein CH373_04570 [Leptospira perolatii]|uniref:Lcl C-terminal domain-containing protein n=1 Tax=Leptospira perolatii TaxID=2023191 RepID=A0A2M9ZR99_9LEPT|nr:DUF1566 domain-containing protein [Leptospira perolatii]PJZ68081.1 hypothetical protein CH360_18090 [Leptospira perolatii]PJZ74463.1 hypothetical protein CH373_04570 [Leptospira perolatii]